MESPLWSYIFGPPKEKRSLFELLRELPIFEGLSNNELAQVARVLHERHYAADELVFNEGEPGAGLYVIQSGEIVITKDITDGTTLELATIHARNFFGELALLDEIPRSASAHARTDSVLLAFSKPDLENMVSRNPKLALKIMTNLSRLVCQRLIKANDNMEKLQRQLTAEQPSSSLTTESAA